MSSSTEKKRKAYSLRRSVSSKMAPLLSKNIATPEFSCDTARRPSQPLGLNLGALSKNTSQARSHHRPIHKPYKNDLTKIVKDTFDYNNPDLRVENHQHRGIIIKSGTKENLIDMITRVGITENDYVIEFLSVYLYFATPNELLESLRTKYFDKSLSKSVQREFRKDIVSATRQRICTVLEKWMNNYPKQFSDAKIIPELSEFISEIDQESLEKRTLLLLLETRLTIFKKVKTYIKEYDFLTPRIPSKSKKSALFLKTVDILAQQLCLMNQKQICSIEIHELFGQKWSKPNAFELTPQITRNIEYFNRVSFWCATEIMQQKSLKKRIRYLKQVILLANWSVKYNNYNTAFAVISALNFTSINRLKQTWKGLSNKYTQMFKEMDDLFSVTDNYFAYKKIIDHQIPPLIPYLGVFLRDLTTLEVGNSTYCEDDLRLINYEKFRKISMVLQEFRMYQQIQYTFPEHKQIQTAIRYSIDPLDEEQLYNISRKLEPP